MSGRILRVVLGILGAGALTLASASAQSPERGPAPSAADGVTPATDAPAADPAPPAPPPKPDLTVTLDRAKVEAFVDGAVAEAIRGQHIAGVTVAIVDRSGLVMAKGYGVAAANPARAADADTLFRVGSISKTPTWIALMQLVEQGKIRLDDPINDHLPPQLRIPDEGFSKPILVRHLMTHSAGFEDSVLGGFFTKDAEHLPTLRAYLAAQRVHRVREPGTLAVYSNYGAALAGAMVETVSGQTWQVYAEQHIFRPLGMTTATYREVYSDALAKARGLPAPMPAETQAHLSAGFDLKAGELEAQKFEYIGNLAPAGALSASAKDMAAYMAALLDPSRLEQAGVLKAATFETMTSPLFTNTPGMGAWRHGFMDFTLSRGRPSFGHGGDLIYQHATLEIYPEPGIAIFVGVNTPTGEPLRDTLSRAVMATFVGPLAPTPPPMAKAAAEAESKRVVGTYRSLRRPTYRTESALTKLLFTSEVTALPGGDILLSAGDTPTRFRPVGDGAFVATEGPGRIVFHHVGGRMIRYDAYSAGPSERIGFFEGSQWLGIIVGLGIFTCLWGVATAVRRMFVRAERDRAAGYILDGLCLLWLAAFGFAAVAAASLGDQNTAVFTYPGPLAPAALWVLAGVAVLTPVAGILAFFVARPRRWGTWRWTRQITALTVLAAMAVTLGFDGFLGYSGW